MKNKKKTDPEIYSSIRWTTIPREQLRHFLILPQDVEESFKTIEKEYVARGRLAHYGLGYRQKILLLGPPGCGKTLGAERLAYNIGLPFIKVRFISSEPIDDLKWVFSENSKNPCLLFADLREAGEDYMVFLHLIEEHRSNSGLVVVATNSLEPHLYKKFDDFIHIPLPGEEEILLALKENLVSMETNSIKWKDIVHLMKGFSFYWIVKIARDAAKSAVLKGKESVSQDDIIEAVEKIKSKLNL